MIVTTVAALWVQIDQNLTGTDLVLGVTAIVLLLLAVGVVAVGVARFAEAVQGHAPRPMLAAAD